MSVETTQLLTWLDSLVANFTVERHWSKRDKLTIAGLGIFEGDCVTECLHKAKAEMEAREKPQPRRSFGIGFGDDVLAAVVRGAAVVVGH